MKEPGVLWTAAHCGHPACLRALLSFTPGDWTRAGAGGVRLNARDLDGDTALIYAVGNLHKQCINILIQAGADVNIANNVNATPLHMIACMDDGHEDILDNIIKAGADIEMEDDFCGTPLMVAVAVGNHRCTSRLIEAGADVNHVNSHTGKTPLMLIKDIQSARILLKAGAEIGHRDHNGHNALEAYMFDVVDLSFMRAQPDSDICRLLLAAGDYPGGTTVGANMAADGQLWVPCCVPSNSLLQESTLCLKHLCREAIRIHLLKLDPHTHLFGRVPRLGLPRIIVDYLLYNMSLSKT